MGRPTPRNELPNSPEISDGSLLAGPCEKWSELMSLRDHYRALLLDLDGTLYRGNAVIAGAPEALLAGEQERVYVTNNASRGAAAVAAHLAELGYPAGPRDVVTSAQAAARLLAEHLDPGSRVLVVGTDDLMAEVKAVGLEPIRQFDDSVPAAVVQGHSPSTGWPDLAEAAYALRAGALWVAANDDKTLPNERGLAPGNGAMVAALRAASDREPVIAGKPYRPLVDDALARAGTRDALVVGDRIDTDIDGAAAAELDAFLVLTGVSSFGELAGLPAQRWPTFIAHDLDALNREPVAAISDDIAAIERQLHSSPGRAVAVRAAGSGIR